MSEELIVLVEDMSDSDLLAVYFSHLNIINNTSRKIKPYVDELGSRLQRGNIDIKAALEVRNRVVENDVV